MKIRLLVWANKGKRAEIKFLKHDEDVEIPPAMSIAYGIKDPDAKEQVITYVHGVMFEHGFDRNSEHIMIALDGVDTKEIYSAPYQRYGRNE